MNTHADLLSAQDKPAILLHFESLTSESLRMRFGAKVHPDLLKKYVQELDATKDILLGVYDGLSLAAFMHAARVPGKNGVYELGVSVLDSHRRLGLAAALVRKVKAIAFYEKWIRVEMLHVRDNVAISKLCKKEGMTLYKDGQEYVGVWESAHAYQYSLDQEAFYLMEESQESE